MPAMNLSWFESLLWQHVSSILTLCLTLLFVAVVLRQRRPTGSAFAWLLIIVLIPYLGIPLYLVFGGRKFRRSQLRKIAKEAPQALSHFKAVEWLDSGEKAYSVFLEEIQKAKHSIRIETFVLGDDEVGRSLMLALIERVKAGVEVHLCLDDLLSFHAPHGLLREFIKVGGHLTKFMPVIHWPFRGRANLRNHRKIAVFDGERAIVGGMNLAEEYMGPTALAGRWRDLSLRLHGPVVDALDEIFRQDWAFAAKSEIKPARTSARPEGQHPVQVLPCGPDSERDSIYEAILTGLFSAKSRFWVATPYFIPDEVLCRALTMAVHRGVDVRIIVPEHSNHALSDVAAASFLHDLAEDGVQVQRYQPGMLHAKALIVDQDLAMVGSANLDMRSLFLNFEISLFFTTEPEIKHLEAWFEKTLGETQSGAPKSGPVRGLLASLLRLLAPLF